MQLMTITAIVVAKPKSEATGPGCSKPDCSEVVLHIVWVSVLCLKNLKIHKAKAVKCISLRRKIYA